jgi:hypothetical protein
MPLYGLQCRPIKEAKSQAHVEARCAVDMPGRPVDGERVGTGINSGGYHGTLVRLSLSQSISKAGSVRAKVKIDAAFVLAWSVR